MVGGAVLGESYWHPISPKAPDHVKSTHRKKEKIMDNEKGGGFKTLPKTTKGSKHYTLGALRQHVNQFTLTAIRHDVLWQGILKFQA